MRILKFGGKSLSSKEKMQNICKYIKKIYKNDKKIIIVVSAMGQTTDNLISISKDFGGEKIDDHTLATLLSVGETKSSALFAMSLEKIGVPAKCFQGHEIDLTTFGNKTEALVAYLDKQKLQETIDAEVVAVVAGFQGVDKNNEITVLGRGGSDTTAAAIGATFESPVEIYSDFNGVFAGDPKKLGYKKIKQLDYLSMIQMAKSGAKVLDKRATEIAKNFKIDIISKSSSQPEKTGSIISSIEQNIISIQTICDLSQISIVFSAKFNMEFIVKNVIFELNNINFYNFRVENNKISFCVSNENKDKVLFSLSKKLKLIK